MFFALCNTLILGPIAAIHFYWLLGGKLGIANALPASQVGQIALKPRMIETLIVALGSTFMAFLHLAQTEVIAVTLPQWINNYGLKAIAAIFLIRAVGEFRYVGFFKKIKNTKFAQLDTWFYSPLCVLLSLNSLITSLQS